MPAVTTLNPTSQQTDPNQQQNQAQQQQQQPGASAMVQATNAGPKPQLPYAQEGQLMPIVKPPKQPATPANATQTDLQQGSNNVMAAAQNAALAGVQQKNPLMGQVQQGASQFMANPLGYDAEQYKKNQLEQYDRNRNAALSAFQQNAADTANTGINLQNAYNFAMQGAQGRTDLENQLNQQVAQEQRDALVNALGLGTSTAQAASGLDTEAFNRLINARGAFEGERAQTQSDTQQMAVLEKTFGQDMAKLVASQNWQGAQNELDRQAAVAKQTNDIAAQQNIIKLQASLDMEKLNKTQDFAAFQADLDRRQQTAMQSNDIDARKYLADLQIKADAAQLQKTQDFQAVQADIDRKLKETMQGNDLTAQTSIIDRQLALDKWKQENGQQFTAEQNSLNRALQSSLQSAQITNDNAQKALDRELTLQVQQGTLSMQEKQLAMQASQFNDELSFKKWAQQSNIDQATADRIWKTSESALDRSGAKDLKQMEIDSQRSLLDLKNKYDQGMLLTQQDFAATQADLDRKEKAALQAGDIQGQLKIQQQRNEFEAMQQKAQQEYNTAERVATQGWQTSERMDTQSFQKAMQYIDQENKIALQNNDFGHAQYLNDQKANLELKAQTQAFDYDKKMAYLNAQLVEAKAIRDVERQKQIIGFQTTQNLNELAAKQGYEIALQNNQAEIQKALQAGEFDHAEQMQLSQLQWQANQNTLDRQVKQAELRLQQQGINTQKMEAEYRAAKDAGDNAGAVAILNKYMQGTGVTIKAPDPKGAAQEAIAADFAAQQYQFAQTHPELWDEANGELTSDGVKQFNEWFNKQTYGNGQKITDIVADVNNTIGGADPKNAGTDTAKAYEALSAKAVDWTPQTRLQKTGVDRQIFVNPPSVGTVIRVDGKLYNVTSGVNIKKIAAQRNREWFTAVDVNTGEIRTFSS